MNRLRRALPLVLLPALLAGCATTSGGGARGADLREAARLNTQMGMDYIRRGRDDLAEEKLLRALEQDRRYAPAHSTYALWLVRQSQPVQAESHFRTAVRLDGNDPDTRNNFGVFLCGRGKREEGVSQLLAASSNPRYPGRATALVNAAECIRDQAPDEAEDYLRRALQVAPESPEALALLARVSLEQDEPLRARAFISRFEAVGRHDADTLRVAALTETALGDEAAAGRYWQQLRDQFPEAARRLSPPTGQNRLR